MTEITNPTLKPSFVRRWLIRLSILIVLIAILIGINLLYASIADTEIVLDGEAGDLLYVSAFDGFLDEWQLYEGQQSAQIIDDAIQLNVTVPSQATWSVAQPTFSDFDVTVLTQGVEGPIDNAYGIMFRLQSGRDDSCDLSFITLCDLGSISPFIDLGIRTLVNRASGANSVNYYNFLISSDGYYSVTKVRDGVEERLSAWIQTPIINQDLNAENTIRVVGRGSQFQFFINDEQMLLCIPNNPNATSTYAGGECIEGTMQGILKDDTIATGQLGAVAQATQTGGGGIAIQFDNFTVFSPSNKIESGESNA